MDSVIIRPAAHTDIDGVRLLQQEWAREEITHGFVPEGEAALRRALGPYFLVAEVDGELAGFVTGSENVSDGAAVVPKGAAYLEVNDLYVLPRLRRRKIGGMLLDRLLAEARRGGLGKALVYSATKDVRGVLKFYEGHGFQPWFVQMFQDL
jgi:GNAT superfamily N-acetyltransferase